MREPPVTPHPMRTSDEDLAVLASAGDRQALEQLLIRHQGWMFNLAVYMLQSRSEAEDATQEILLKITTKLATFQRRSAFRTWAYRIAVNHLLDRRRSQPEQAVGSFDCFASYLAAAPDLDLSEGRSSERALLVEEARMSCMMGMLLCLDRSQRMIFLLGELLDTRDVVAAELMQLSRDNYRQRLSRARRQLSRFMNEECGLVNPGNACRCARKTAAFIRDGIVDPERLQFASGRVDAAREASPRRSRQLGEMQARTFAELRACYPLFEPPDLAARLRRLIESPGLRTLLELDSTAATQQKDPSA